MVILLLQARKEKKKPQEMPTDTLYSIDRMKRAFFSCDIFVNPTDFGYFRRRISIDCSPNEEGKKNQYENMWEYAKHDQVATLKCGNHLSIYQLKAIIKS